MSDIFHYFGQDLQVDASGDILCASGVVESQQAVIRRLLTNAGDYIWHTEYGASLPQFVGQPVQEGAITGVVRQNMYLEASVQQNPPPVVAITATPADGVVELDVQYIDATDGQRYNLNLPLGGN